MKFPWRKYLLDNEGYRIDLLRKRGRQVYKLIDKIHASSIEVVPEHGNNIISFNVLKNGKNHNVLYQPRDFVRKNGGIPILWPFANRIRHGKFNWQGIEHDLTNEPDTTGDFKGNVIHGMVRGAVWQVRKTGINQHGVFMEGYLNTKDYPSIKKHFGMAEIKVIYHLAGNKLKIDLTVENLGQQFFPMSLALHPWFNLPLTRRGKRTDVILRLPAAKRWETMDGLPTGRQLDVSEGFDFRKERKIGKNTYDDVFTSLEFDPEGMAVSELYDPSSEIGVSIRASNEFRNLVLYVPKDNKRVVCVEPQTSATDVFNLQQNKEANLIVLAKGEKFSAAVEFEIFTD